MARRYRKLITVTQEIETYNKEIDACHSRIRKMLQQVIDTYNADPHLKKLGIRVDDIATKDRS